MTNSTLDVLNTTPKNVLPTLSNRRGTQLNSAHSHMLTSILFPTVPLGETRDRRICCVPCVVAEVEDHLAKTHMPAEEVGNVLQWDPPTPTPKQVLSSD